MLFADLLNGLLNGAVCIHYCYCNVTKSICWWYIKWWLFLFYLWVCVAWVCMCVLIGTETLCRLYSIFWTSLFLCRNRYWHSIFFSPFNRKNLCRCARVYWSELRIFFWKFFSVLRCKVTSFEEIFFPAWMLKIRSV